ncbi:MAG: Crp/Fnr family transcriptional regulator [Gemmatimonadaceae bacterium]|nr:Crp/Fnr family transcriptional regulator [Gemmatimonadaceae bacterium]
METGPKLDHSEAALERNSLLRALSAEDYAKVMEHAITVPLRPRQDLVEPGEAMRYAWFPQRGMLSLVNDMKDGKTSIEVGVIGREGIAGLALFHGRETQPMRILVQVAGEAKRIPADAFKALIRQTPTLRDVLHRYTLALLNQAGQQVACNRLHSLEQRCAKWLLTTHDHMDAQELPLTQEFLAIMLGVRRPGVTVAAQALQDAGLISYRRGRITITDRHGLEQIACECYGRIREDYEHLLGDVMIPPSTASEGRPLQVA